MLFQVSYGRFIKEIGVEKLKAGDRDSLEVEDLGDGLAYYLTSLDRPKSYVFVVLKKELTNAQRITLEPLSRPVDRRITDDMKLRNISETLKRIEENLNKIPTQGKIIEREIIREE